MNELEIFLLKAQLEGARHEIERLRAELAEVQSHD